MQDSSRKHVINRGSYGICSIGYSRMARELNTFLEKKVTRIAQWFRSLAMEPGAGSSIPHCASRSRASLGSCGQAAQSQDTPEERKEKSLLKTLYRDSLSRQAWNHKSESWIAELSETERIAFCFFHKATLNISLAFSSQTADSLSYPASSHWRCRDSSFYQIKQGRENGLEQHFTTIASGEGFWEF